MLLYSDNLFSSVFFAESNTVKILLVIAFIIIFIGASVVSGIMTFKARMKKIKNNKHKSEISNANYDSSGD